MPAPFDKSTLLAIPRLKGIDMGLAGEFACWFANLPVCFRGSIG
jgi:hypothetical protein